MIPLPQEVTSVIGTVDEISLPRQGCASQVVVIPPALIHGDYTVDNVFVDNQQITGILDWAGGDYGDCRYDPAVALGTSPNLFTAEDIEAFYAGYGGTALTEAEIRYFVDLYLFFETWESATIK